MKHFWVEFNKVFLRISMIIGFIAVIILTFVTSDQNDTVLALAVLFGGVVIVFSAHSLWGLLVEAAGNLANLPEEMKYKIGHLSRNLPGDMTQSDNFGNWYCPFCGNTNHIDMRFCTQCGKPKGE